MKDNVLAVALLAYLAESDENAAQLAQRAQVSKNTIYRALKGMSIGFFAAERLLACAGYSLQATTQATPTTPPGTTGAVESQPAPQEAQDA